MDSKLYLTREVDGYGGVYHLWIGQPVFVHEPGATWPHWSDCELDVEGLRKAQQAILVARWMAPLWAKGSGPQLCPGSCVEMVVGPVTSVA